MDTLAEDAAALIEHLELGRCHFAGNSMGGFVALRLAARRPELVRTVAAMGSSAEEEHKLAEFSPLVKHLGDHGPEQVTAILMHIMFGDLTLSAPSRAAIRDEWRGYMLTLPTSIGDAAYQVIHRQSIAKELTETTVPVLAIMRRPGPRLPAPAVVRTPRRGRADRTPRHRRRCRALRRAGGPRRRHAATCAATSPPPRRYDASCVSTGHRAFHCSHGPSSVTCQQTLGSDRQW